MREAIDYNALSWVRQEIGETLNKARQQLEEYADSRSEDALHGCAARLHETRGPLQMVNLRGADMLAGEMEEIVADLLTGSVSETDAALELLMQAFLELPEYMYSLRPGRSDNPGSLFPLVNSLRAVRGQQPLEDAALFSPNLAAHVPVSVFDPRADHSRHDVAKLARAARLRFQAGLLEWFRNNDSDKGMPELVRVLDHLQQHAGTEAVARCWWISGGVAELVRDGRIDTSAETRQLFGQIDRQIKRLLDQGEAVFSDMLTDDLVKNLLFRLYPVDSGSERITQIRQTYGLDAGTDSAACSDELLETVSATVLEDVARIKEQMDSYLNGNRTDGETLVAVADQMHALSNTLGMIGMDQLGATVAGMESLLRDWAGGTEAADDDFVELANLLVAVEDAMTDVMAAGQGGSSDDATFRQGQGAVISAVLGDMANAKEAMNNFFRSSADFGLLVDVPVIMNRIHGGLEMAGQDRIANATSMLRTFVARELVDARRQLSDEDLDTLADAVCSIEYCVEELAGNRDYGERAIRIAEESLARLGYECPQVEPTAGEVVEEPATTPASAEVVEFVREKPEEPVVADEPEVPSAPVPAAGVASGPGTPTGTPASTAADKATGISGMQVIDPDADPEILEIFIEEAGEVLEVLRAQVPAWCNDPADAERLGEIRRAFHTLKGSGRMVGALATGEFAWALENMTNRLIDNTVSINQHIVDVIGEAPAALAQLVAQVSDANATIDFDADAMAGRADALSRGELPGQPADMVTGNDVPAEVTTGEGTQTAPVDEVAPAADQPAEGQLPELQLSEFPVLADGADPEIVEIFLEEATGEFDNISVNIPSWITNTEDRDMMSVLQRCFHTLKGSGRMAGAMQIGEFSWYVETLLNRLLDGTVEQSAGLFRFMIKVPEILSEMLDQVRNGSEPETDLQEMFGYATVLVNGGTVEFGSAPAEASAEPETPVAGEAPVSDRTGEDVAEVEESPEEPTLIEIFARECADHLVNLNGWVDDYSEPGSVSDALFRSLHTLSGICQSAEMYDMGRLADGLYAWFGSCHEEQQQVPADAHAVLRDCTREMERQVTALPELEVDSDVIDALCLRIEALPAPVAEQAEPDESGAVEPEQVEPEGIAVQSAADETADVDGQAVEAMAGSVLDEDPYADMDPELYEIFVEEAGEVIDASESVLRSWAEEPENMDLVAEFQRHLHTLKGSARMVDLMIIGNLSHAVESVMTRIADGELQTSEDLFTILSDAHDRLADMLEQVKGRKPCVAADDLEAALNGIAEGGAVEIPSAVVASEPADEPVVAEETAGDTGQEAEVADAVSEPAIEPEAAVESATGVEPDTTEEVTEPVRPVRKDGRVVSPPRLVIDHDKPARQRGEQVRVQSDALDNMVNYAGEINIYRARMEQQVSDYRFNLGELDSTINRLRDQLRKLEMETEAQILYRFEQESEQHADFDPLEMDRYSTLQQLSRSLIESISDLSSLQDLMDNTTRDSETLLLQQSRVSTELQESLIRTRMIPFASLSPRLRRIVRQSARQLDKKVELELVGEEGEMDRAVVERIVAPLEHMLRNSVAHGIELPADRKSSNKAATGKIRIEFDREGSEIVLRISDDGAGMNIDAIRARAIERGLMEKDADLPEEDIVQFVLHTGFSTAETVTQISGRGVGMDVVNSEVKQLGGSLHITSESGRGATFTVRLPYTLAINQAMLVTAGDETFCIPLASVEGVVRFYPSELKECYADNEQQFHYGENAYRLKHLAGLLGTGAMNLPADEREQVPVVLVRVGDKRIGFHIEALQGIREVVIKPVGAQLSTVDGISGATILGDGSVVMILDIVAVSRREPVIQTEIEQPERKQDGIVVMVVDDSITVRKVTTRLLERNGFKVVTAKDGVDAMGKLQESTPDMMLLDIEMPRMDGFELATHMRNDDGLRNVPIIMITSRTGDKHRERAEQIGVQNYLGKPYQESDLLDSINEILGIGQLVAHA